EPQQLQAAIRRPAPARLEDWRRQRSLLKKVLGRDFCQKVEYVRQRKAVLLGQRYVDAVIGRGRLQFEIEAAAEALAQRQPPPLVDAPTERGMQDQLHPTAFIEESFRNDGRLRWHCA